MRKRNAMILMGVLAGAYVVSYAVLFRKESAPLPEDMLPGRYTTFVFPGTKTIHRPNGIEIHRGWDQTLTVVFYPLIKLDRVFFRHLHHRQYDVEMKHDEHGHCMGVPGRVILY